MFQPFEIFMALRYLRSRSRNRFVSFIALISVVGIALAVAVLIVVLSVMNGFQTDVRERILSVVSHGTISGIDGRLDAWREIEALAARDPEVRSSAPYVAGQGMLVSDTATAGIEIRGIEPAAEARTSGVARLLQEGRLDALGDRSWNIILGDELAARLEVAVGDSVILLTPDGSVTPAGVLPRMRRFEITGIFSAGMYEYDRGLAFIHLRDAARLLRLGDAVSGVSFAVTEPLAAGARVRALAEAHGGGVYISDWTRQHANFFRSIEITKSTIFFILLLVVAVAAFNIVSTLMMVVREKAAEIAILRSMGASARSILAIFLGEGMFIGLFGTGLGLLVGWLLAINLGTLVAMVESLLQIRFVAPDVYFISELPSQFRWSDASRICAIAFLLALCATVYPALRGAATNPAEALRHD